MLIYQMSWKIQIIVDRINDLGNNAYVLDNKKPVMKPAN